MGVSKSKKRPPRADRSVLQMTAKQARKFFLKAESYCNVEFPPYLNFSKVLSAVAKELLGKSLASMSSKPWEYEGVNYSILSNKDGRHAWRPLQLIHPALYVSLVEQITSDANWKTIRDRFSLFRKIPNFKCLSIPIEASRSSDKAAQILSWWQGVEQGSIELALDYNCAFHADVTDCYSAIYTHSIAWAIHTKPVAKAGKKDPKLIGNVIDTHIQNMRHGQTNGIPQGSVLMDLVSEIVLGFADLNLSERLAAASITDFRILRYRDDYRVFVQSPHVGECILKMLTEVLIDLGLKLSTEKTTGRLQVVQSSLKADKFAWLKSRQGDRSLQKHLLVIHAHGTSYPNGGSLTVALSLFLKRLSRVKRPQNPLAIISIAVDIAYTSPKAFPLCAAIISHLLAALGKKSDAISVIQKIHTKLSQLPNTGHMEIWLQRISYSFDRKLPYAEALCGLVSGSKLSLWNNDWISSTRLKAAIDPLKIVNKAKLKSLKAVVRPKEVSIFELLGEYSS